MFFALSFPFSYADVGAMLDRVDAKFRERSSHGEALRARVAMLEADVAARDARDVAHLVAAIER